VPVVAGRPGHAVDDEKMTGAVGRGLVAPREGTAVEARHQGLAVLVELRLR
jgi:hypothetical protein